MALPFFMGESTYAGVRAYAGVQLFTTIISLLMWTVQSTWTFFHRKSTTSKSPLCTGVYRLPPRKWYTAKPLISKAFLECVPCVPRVPPKLALFLWTIVHEHMLFIMLISKFTGTSGTHGPWTMDICNRINNLRVYH